MKILLIILGLIYVLSPYDILPDYFVGWGWLDDIVLIFFLWRFLKNLSQKQSGAKSFYQQRRQYFEQNKRSNEKESPGTNSGFKKASIKDPFKVLNIPRNASREEIKKSYKQLANKYHPDKVLHLGDEFKKLAEERFKEIQEAYRELSSN